MTEKGIKFPFRINNGAPEEAKEEELAASEMGLLMAQNKGERVYSPQNGLSLRKYLFENLDAYLRSNIRRDSMISVNRFVNRVTLISVNTSISIQDGERVVELVVIWKYNGKQYAVSRPLSELFQASSR